MEDIRCSQRRIQRPRKTVEFIQLGGTVYTFASSGFLFNFFALLQRYPLAEATLRATSNSSDASFTRNELIGYVATVAAFAALKVPQVRNFVYERAMQVYHAMLNCLYVEQKADVLDLA